MLNNAFGAFGPTTETSDDGSVDSIATQMAAVTLQSQLTTAMAANSAQRHGQGMQALAQQQQLLNASQHQIMEQLAALSFNTNNAGQGIRRGGCGGGRGTAPPPICSIPPPHMFKLCRCLQPTSKDMEAAGVGEDAAEEDARKTIFPMEVSPLPRERAMCFPLHMRCPLPLEMGEHVRLCPSRRHARICPSRRHAIAGAAPYSNIVKCFVNWNACYTCGFDVPDGHTSMPCQAQHKAGHGVYFTRQNTQQYIDAGRNCCTCNRHKTKFPAM